jgi:hypothetical protein
VAFPDGQKKIVKFAPEQALLPILKKICQQRQMVYEEYTCLDACENELTVTGETLMAEVSDRFVLLRFGAKSEKSEEKTASEEREVASEAQPVSQLALPPDPQQQQQQSSINFAPKSNVSPRAYTPSVSPATSAKLSSLRTSNSNTVQLSQIRSASPVVPPLQHNHSQPSVNSTTSSLPSPTSSTVPSSGNQNSIQYVSPALTTIPSSSQQPAIAYVSPALTTIQQQRPPTTELTPPSNANPAMTSNSSPTSTNIPPYLRSVNLHPSTQQQQHTESHVPTTVNSLTPSGLSTNNPYQSYYHANPYATNANAYGTNLNNVPSSLNPNIPHLKPSVQPGPKIAYTAPSQTTVQPYHPTPYQHQPTQNYTQPLLPLSSHQHSSTSPLTSPVTSPRPVNPMLTPDLIPKPHLRPGQMPPSANRISAPSPKLQPPTHTTVPTNVNNAPLPSGSLRDSNPNSHGKPSYHEEVAKQQQMHGQAQTQQPQFQ